MIDSRFSGTKQKSPLQLSCGKPGRRLSYRLLLPENARAIRIVAFRLRGIGHDQAEKDDAQCQQGTGDKEEDAEGVMYTGFVSDEQKRAILQHAELLLNPSKSESLSLVLLEALNDRVPVLVNGHCNVLREHCRKSGGAILYYTGKHSFIKGLGRIVSDQALRASMQERGKEYMEKNYSWDLIMPRLYKAIDEVTGETTGK